MTENTTNRDIWEDRMAAQLRKSGVAVITGGKAFAGDDKITKEEVLAYVKQHGTDAVLVTRLVDVKKERAYYQSSTGYMGSSYGRSSYGPSNSFSRHYSNSYNVVSTPGYTATLTLVLLETNLYQSSSQDLVWSVSSETFDPQSVNDLVGIIGDKVLKSLTKHNLI